VGLAFEPLREPSADGHQQETESRRGGTLSKSVLR